MMILLDRYLCTGKASQFGVNVKGNVLFMWAIPIYLASQHMARNLFLRLGH